MIGSVLGVTPAQINALRAKPSLVRHLVLVVRENQWKAQVDDVIKSAPAERRAQLEAYQARFEQSPAGTEVAARAAEARAEIAVLGAIENVLSLETSWHVLHYLFTGNVLPDGSPGDLLLASEDIVDGPARLHGEARTREFGHFLAGLDLARLLERIDLKDMRRVGVDGIPFEPDADAEYEQALREEVGFCVPRLRDYVRAMSDKGNGLLIWVA